MISPTRAQGPPSGVKRVCVVAANGPLLPKQAPRPIQPAVRVERSRELDAQLKQLKHRAHDIRRILSESIPVKTRQVLQAELDTLQKERARVHEECMACIRQEIAVALQQADAYSKQAARALEELRKAQLRIAELEVASGSRGTKRTAHQIT